MYETPPNKITIKCSKIIWMECCKLCVSSLLFGQFVNQRKWLSVTERLGKDEGREWSVEAGGLTENLEKYMQVHVLLNYLKF